MSVQQNTEQIRDYLKVQFNLPGDQIDTMIPGFIKTLSGHMEHLESVLELGDLQVLGKTAHMIKGALLNLGLHDCAETAFAIEKNARTGNQDADYQRLVASLREKLNSYLN